MTIRRAIGLCMGLLASAVSVAAGSDLRQRSDALWSAREDIAKAGEAIVAYETLEKEDPRDYEILLRLSRLHYWIGQNLEAQSPKEALSHYVKGKDYGRKASEAATGRPGGYFFEGANLARENGLKGTLSNLFGISKVKKLNEKAAGIDPDYFFRGPDRFFCAYFTRLPGIFGGNVERAVEHGRRAVDAHPNYAGNRVFLAEAYLKAGKTDLARKELEAAVALADGIVPDFLPEQKLEKKRAAELLRKINVK